MLEELVGQSLGHYQIVSLRGEGGMGAVFKGFDVTLQRDVAIKVMHPHIARQPNFQERFLQEARVAAKLDHPSIVRVYDFGFTKSLLYIVMKFIPGANLEQMLHDLKAQGKWLRMNEAVQIIRQVALALDYAHQQGVLHRDIKPGNIMIEPVTSDDLPYRPVITDLGLAKLAGGGVITMDGTSMGTPAYMSPEQALGQPTDARSDVYSLGVLLFELATGQLPFPAKTLTEAIHYHTTQAPPAPHSINSSIPLELEQVILGAMEKNPVQRISSAGALAKALEALFTQPTEITEPTVLGTAVSLITQYQQSLIEPRGPSILKEFTTPVNLTKDTIQVLSDGKTSQAVAMKAGGLTVGREGDNDIVLNDPKTSRHHTRIEFDGKNYQVIDLNSSNGSYLANTRLLPGIPEVWSPDKALRVGDTWLRLVRVSPAPGVASGTVLTSGAGRSIDATLFRSSAGQGRVGIYLNPSELSVEPGQSLTLPVVLLNQGSLVDQFNVSASGIPEAWVKGGAKSAQLMPGDQKELSLDIQPPRAPQSKAGSYPLTVSASSQDDPSQVAQVKTNLTVSSYSQFSSQLQPQKIAAGQAGRVTISNQGNLQETYKLDWKDRADELNFRSKQGQLTIPEGTEATAEFQAVPRKKRLIGGEKSHTFTVQVTPSKGDSQTHNGEVVSRGMIPAWVIPVFFLLCVLVSGGAYKIYPTLFPTPTITPTPKLTATLTPSVTPLPGAPVFDAWCIYPNNQPPAQFKNCPSQVIVTKGQMVTIQWSVSNTDSESVQLSPLGNRGSNGKEDYLPLETTDFKLSASNRGVSWEQTIKVIVELPTSTSTEIPTSTSTPTPPATLTPTPTKTPTYGPLLLHPITLIPLIPIHPIYYNLVTYHSGKCIGVSGGSTDSGKNLVQWQCNGNDDQLWNLQSKAGGYYKLVNKNSGKCAGVAGGSMDYGAWIVQWDCIDVDDQLWSKIDLGNTYNNFVNKQSGLCLVVKDVSNDDGALIIQWGCDNSDHQWWFLHTP
jgi:serine/threonine protein kinase